jgi:hypothetical protein
MGHDAGIQLYGRNKPLIPPVQPVQSIGDKKQKTMSERKKKLLLKKEFLDKKTIEYLKRVGLINT